MMISELQKHVADFSEKNGWDDSSIEFRSLFLITEVGELMKEVLKINKAIQDGSLDELKQNIGFEIFDVVWNIFDIANKFNIDLEEAFKKKMEINNQRSWQ